MYNNFPVDIFWLVDRIGKVWINHHILQQQVSRRKQKKWIFDGFIFLKETIQRYLINVGGKVISFIILCCAADTTKNRKQMMKRRTNYS